jgi:EAL domain-containing protein (putative c-di-GMP-specific phosphodiesterase class I)/CHASE2 domain-containing sensor protein
LVTQFSLRRLWERFRTAPRVRILSYALLASVLCGVTGFLDPLDDYARSLRYSLRYVPADGSIVMISIDQKTEEQLGTRYPWPRTFDARLIEQLKQNGVRKIVFDRAFSNVDSDANNAVLVKTLDRYRGAIYFGSGVLSAERGRIKTAMFPAKPYRKHVEIGSFVHWSNPLGQVAKLYVSGPMRGDPFPALSVILSGKPKPSLTSYRPDFSIQSSTVPTVSFGDVVLGKVKREQLAGRDVIVGIGELVLGDSAFVPGQGRVQGVYTHIIGAQTLKRGIPVEFGWVYPFLATLGAGIILLRMRHVAAAGIVTVACIGALCFLPLLLDSELISVDIAPAMLFFGITLVQHARLTFGWRKSRTHESSGLPNVMALREVTALRQRALIAARIDNHAAITASFAKDVEPLITSEIVSRLKVGDTDTTVYQGDEGVYYLLSPIVDRHLMSEHLDGLHALFSQPLTVGNRRVDVAITFGVDDQWTRTMVSRIGSAMLCAEEASRQGARWKIYDASRGADAAWNLSLGSEIDRGLAEGEFWVAYQPKLDLRTNHIVGAEVLARWTHPERGAIGPGEFIPVAERDHRIERLTQFVFRQVMSDAVQLQGMNDLKLALNVSVPVLRRPDFARFVIGLTRDFGLRLEMFTIEITESVFLSADDEVVTENLRQLTEAGLGLSIDDFGTGFSTLESLQRVPANEVKIDQTFVKSLLTKPGDRIIVSSIIRMAQDLKRRVVAEGVESAETLALLTALGCDEAQGYFIGRPQSLDDFIATVTSDDAEVKRATG